MTRAGFVLLTDSPEETEHLGMIAGRIFPPGTLLCLSGELGAGKTAFVRGLAKGIFGPHVVQVTSPTYVLMHVYRSETTPTGSLYHLDVYRLGTGVDDGSADFMGAGLGECLEDKSSWVCIEWPERIRSILPPDRIEIEIDHLGEDRREVHILATGPMSGKLIDELVMVAGTREQFLASFQGNQAPPTPPSLS